MKLPLIEGGIIEGKTKKIIAADRAGQVIIESKDDLTAGDGAKHDIIKGKGALSNRTTSNVFRFLKTCGLPVAFIKELDETRFCAEWCSMFPYEVVVRREAHGSFVHRNPHIKTGRYFPKLILEYFAKTNKKVWYGQSIPMDDPYMDLSGNQVKFFIPHWNDEQKEESKKTGFKGFLVGQKPFLEIPRYDFLFQTKSSEWILTRMNLIAKMAFLALEKAWQLIGKHLVDFKVEFGMNTQGELQIADVIDNDSWRVLDNGNYIDKQLYRDGSDLNTVIEKYRLVADLTANFSLPQQQIILWRASRSDDLKPFTEAIAIYGARETCKVEIVTCSLHKEPIRAYEEIGKLVQEIPDSVVIAYAGLSNGAGPTLSAQITVPVITVPATWRDFPEDIWSSLRMPSETPVATILYPKNAVLSAFQILAMRNPCLYAGLRFRQEERLYNIAI